MYPPGEAQPGSHGGLRGRRGPENMERPGERRKERREEPNLISVHDCPQRGHVEARESEGQKAAGHRHLHLLPPAL